MINADLREILSSGGERMALASQDGQTVSFQRLDDLADRFAARLMAGGVMAGQRLMVLADNDALRVVLWVATWRLGADLVLGSTPAGPASVGIEVDHVVAFADQPQVSGPKWHVVDQTWAETPPRTADDEPPEMGRLFFATSGSTGAPKYMSRPTEVVWASMMGLAKGPLAPSGPVLLGFPAPTASGLMAVLFTLAAGQGVVFPSGEATAILEVAQARGISRLTANPLFLERIVRAIEAGAAPPAVDMVSYSGAQLDRGLIARAHRAFGVPVVCIFGTVEADSVAFGTYTGQELPDGWAGDVLPHLEVAIRGAGEWPDLGPDIGRLAVRIPPERQAQGYFGGGPIHDEDGWFETGDLAQLGGPEGRSLTLAGRADFVANVGGTRFAPERVEAALTRFPDVADAGAVGVTVDGRAGLGVAVVPNGTFDEDAAMQVLERLVRRTGVVRILVVDTLPALPSGKLDRAALKRLLSD